MQVTSNSFSLAYMLPSRTNAKQHHSNSAKSWWKNPDASPRWHYTSEGSGIQICYDHWELLLNFAQLMTLMIDGVLSGCTKDQVPCGWSEMVQEFSSTTPKDQPPQFSIQNVAYRLSIQQSTVHIRYGCHVVFSVYVDHRRTWNMVFFGLCNVHRQRLVVMYVPPSGDYIRALNGPLFWVCAPLKSEDES